ncbi:MAG: NIL domain-containing protein [Planctomycetes bacterium]|nr:NIL domain-containing protein [Planctomycetota bacterium]
MTKETQKSLRLKLNFPEKVLGDPIIYQLSHDLDVIPNILRGRITEKSAWLEVEFTGTAKSLDKARQFLTERGVTFTEMH